jgi:hypothetical protein
MNEEQARLLANDLTRTGLPATAFRPVVAPPGEYYIEVLGADGRYRVLKTVQESEALLERSWNALEQNEELSAREEEKPRTYPGERPSSFQP